jgi:hypothetical protein
MVRNGETNKKIWFTEFGYCSNPTPPPGYEYCRYLTGQNQAQFLVDAFQKARALDYVAGMVVWNLNFQLAEERAQQRTGAGGRRLPRAGRAVLHKPHQESSRLSFFQ